MLRIEWMSAGFGNAGDGVFLIRKTETGGRVLRNDMDAISAQ